MEHSTAVPSHLKAYVCVHVFEGARPVLLVSCPGGDWCFLCREAHQQSAADFKVVGIGHLLEYAEAARLALAAHSGEVCFDAHGEDHRATP